MCGRVSCVCSCVRKYEGTKVLSYFKVRKYFAAVHCIPRVKQLPFPEDGRILAAVEPDLPLCRDCEWPLIFLAKHCFSEATSSQTINTIPF
jgi:hypothetical protein